MEMHLFDENSRDEEALCRVETLSEERRSVKYYLEDRVHGSSVGNVCEECKVLAIPLARVIVEAAVEEHEAEGRFDVAEDYHELGKTLARETGQDRGGD